MRITFWGCRGSIPVPDRRMMKYGGDTTCVEVELDGHILIIDAGTGIRNLGEDLLRRSIKNAALFITHSHWDHTQGFPFFAPVHTPDFSITIHGCTGSQKKLRSILTHQLSSDYFPVTLAELKANIVFSDACPNTEIHGYKITTIANNHPIDTVGFRIENNGRAFVFITDNELAQANPTTTIDQFVEFCRGATLLVHDAQFTDEEYPQHIGWGHSTFEQVIDLARKAEVEQLGFFHHDPGRQDDALDRLEQKFIQQCNEVETDLEVFVVKQKQEFDLV